MHSWLIEVGGGVLLNEESFLFLWNTERFCDFVELFLCIHDKYNGNQEDLVLYSHQDVAIEMFDLPLNGQNTRDIPACHWILRRNR
tara:strand:+ start:143 stop:400 length:258 start_codon:yes stop_codon:yes gene_type:complete